jgi:thermostable 8-oxoguanine DNA glycosylase
VGHSRSRKIKAMPLRELGGEDVFYMNLEEVREALSDKYEFLQERHERSKVARNRRPAAT